MGLASGAHGKTLEMGVREQSNASLYGIEIGMAFVQEHYSLFKERFGVVSDRVHE